MNRRIAALACLVLAGCGGGGGGTEQPSSDPAPAPAPPRVPIQAPAPAPAPKPAPLSQPPAVQPGPEDPNPLPVRTGPTITLRNNVALFGDGMLYVPGLELAQQITNEVHNWGVGSYTSADALSDYLAYPDKSRTIVIWAGHNNFRGSTTLVSDIASMIAAAGHQRFIVIGMVTSDREDEWVGGVDRITKDQLNATLKATYGDKYLDAQALLTSWANPNNSQDRADLTHGATPSTTRDVGNGIHLRAESGALIIVNRLREMLQDRGW